MPKSGEKNKEFGIYKNVCCDAEIVISVRATFPHCPNHPTHATTWSPLESGNHQIDENNATESDAAASLFMS